MNDKELILRFRSGDESAFEQLILKYRKNAIFFATRYLHDLYEAEDIVQDAFAYIYVYRDKYNSNYSFKTYLFTIIRNKCIDYIRRSEKLCFDLEFHMLTYETPEKNILAAEQFELLKENFKKLKDSYQMVVYLIDYEGFSYKEAAKIMNKSPSQIKILIYRARNRLRSLMELEGN